MNSEKAVEIEPATRSYAYFLRGGKFAGIFDLPSGITFDPSRTFENAREREYVVFPMRDRVLTKPNGISWEDLSVADVLGQLTGLTDSSETGFTLDDFDENVKQVIEDRFQSDRK
ncbi:MAG TPA: hypothetical protein VF996_01965 [Candidatus Saccharimonadales bacterium]